MQIFQNEEPFSVYTRYLSHIIDYSQQCYELVEYFEDDFVQKIADITENYITLYLHRQSTSSVVMLPYVPGRQGFVVCWGNTVYGSLQVKICEDGPQEYILPHHLCERLAKDCAWCFYNLEKEIQNQGQNSKIIALAQKKLSQLSNAQYKVSVL